MDPLLLDSVTLSWGPDLLVASLAGAAERVLGRPADELVGRPLSETLGVSAGTARDLHEHATPGGAVEHLASARDGHTVCLRVTALLLEGEGRAASVVNLTALLDGAPPLQISKLASSLSHEIRNPLSSVKMAVQTLARNPDLSDRDRRRLTIANREIRTMERMLWLLSEYGRDTPPATELTSVRALFQEAAGMVEEELSERRVQLEFHEEGGGEFPKVKADPGRLRPVLSQLLLNVAQGLAPGSHLWIKLVRSGKGVRAVLADPSSAVLSEERGTLYEPFGSRLARGAGLSLAVLRRVMNGHGGQFEAEGDGNPGTLYTLTFAG